MIPRSMSLYVYRRQSASTSYLRSHVRRLFLISHLTFGLQREKELLVAAYPSQTVELSQDGFLD